MSRLPLGKAAYWEKHKVPEYKDNYSYLYKHGGSSRKVCKNFDVSVAKAVRALRDWKEIGGFRGNTKKKYGGPGQKRNTKGKPRKRITKKETKGEAGPAVAAAYAAKEKRRRGQKGKSKVILIGGREYPKPKKGKAKVGESKTTVSNALPITSLPI